jgi:energy-coupling factor transporter ATP-binding protein EcfA2
VLELALKADADEAARALLAPLLAGRTTLVLGPSGMGKSTLINLLVPAGRGAGGRDLAGAGTGRHTTTTTTWYWLDDAARGALIDSPGFQEFGLRQIAPEQLAALMPDLRAHWATAASTTAATATSRAAACAPRGRGEISAVALRIYEAVRGAVAASAGEPAAAVRLASQPTPDVGQRQQRHQQHPQHHRAPDQADHAVQVAICGGSPAVEPWASAASASGRRR